MIVYVVTLMIAICIAYAFGKKKYTFAYQIGSAEKRDRNLYLGSLIAALPFIFITTLRYNVGTDYGTYTTFYAESIPNGTYLCEPLFNLLVKFSVEILNCPQLIVAFIGILFCLFMFGFIYEFSLNYELSILVFFLSGTFNWSLNIMRQMLVTAMFLYSIKYIENKKAFKFFLINFMGIFIHKTALLYLPLYFLLKIKNKRKWLIIVFGAGSYLLSGSIREIIKWLSFQTGFYAGYFGAKYDTGKGSFTLVIVNLWILFLAFFIKNDKEELIDTILINIQSLCFILSALAGIIPNGSRMVYMLMPVQCVCVPRIIKKISSLSKRILMSSATLVLYICFFLYYFYFKNYGGTFPYQFY